jgi:predicted site-specific integrase-resolvase
MSTETAMTFDYARVSTAGQDEALQVDALEQAGCDRVFTDHASGETSSRPALLELLGMGHGVTRSSSRGSTGSGAPCVTCSRWSVTWSSSDR